MRVFFSSPNRFVLLILAVCVVVAGCAYSSVHRDKVYAIQSGDRFRYEIENQTDMPGPELEIMKQRLDATLESKGLLGRDANRLLQITVTKYRFRSDTMRILTGNLTGNDAIVSTVVVKDIADGAVLGKEKVITHNPTVISEVRDLVETHADKIVSSLSD